MILPLVVALLLAGQLVSTTASQPTTSDSGHAANPQRSDPASEAELWLIRDHMKEGDKLLKELMQERYQSVKEQLKDGDTRLKEQLVEGDSRLKEQLHDSNSKLKEQLSEEEEWLKEQLAREEARVKQELKRGSTRRTEELQRQSEAIDTMRKLLTDWTQKNDATITELKEKMADMTTQLQTTKGALQTTKDKLRGTQTALQAVKDTLQSTQDSLHTTQTSLLTTRQDLRTTRLELQNSTTDLKATKEDLQTTKDKLQTATDDLQTTKEELEAANNKITSLQNSPFRAVSEQSDDPYNFDFTGSTFVRWGRLTCPNNTTLVYAGVVGGSWHAHTGGATNHLCLTSTPLFHSKTAANNYVYGTEYDGLSGHGNQDAICSVCRAPQPTTIMVPGTYVCPEGWTLQYSGYIVTSAYDAKHGTNYICLDENFEDRVGGHVSHDGNRLWFANAQCGSLPCPPYIASRTVTCAVCSM